jgi:hypothetical protein
MRRVAYLAVPLAAVWLAGCAVLNKQQLKPVPETLTHGRFVYLADRTCRRDIRQARRAFRRKPTNHAMFDKDMQALVKGYEQALFDLRALAPPPADAKPFKRVLASFNYEDLLVHNLLQAGDQGQAEKVKTLLKKLDAADRTLKARASELGLHACARE